MCGVISIKYSSWYKLAEIVGILAMGAHTWMRIFYFCSAGQEVSRLLVGGMFPPLCRCKILLLRLWRC